MRTGLTPLLAAPPRLTHPDAYVFSWGIRGWLSTHFRITTSGNFRTQTLIDCILEVGADRILFSTDYPFEQVAEAADWFDRASISERDRCKIGRLNAMALFKLNS